jgi:hypothetical protein
MGFCIVQKSYACTLRHVGSDLAQRGSGFRPVFTSILVDTFEHGSVREGGTETCFGLEEEPDLTLHGSAQN